MPAVRSAFLELCLQAVADLVGVAAQRRRLLGVVVIGVLVGEMPERGLALHGDELLEVLDVEHRLGRVGHAPDDDRGDLDRVAAASLTLIRSALEVAHAERDPLAPEDRERVDPPQPGLGQCARRSGRTGSARGPRWVARPRTRGRRARSRPSPRPPRSSLRSSSRRSRTGARPVPARRPPRRPRVDRRSPARRAGRGRGARAAGRSRLDVRWSCRRAVSCHAPNRDDITVMLSRPR